MGLLKKIILVIIILALYVAGNIDGQANALISQGSNLLVLLFAVVIIYIFFKLIFKAMGCLPSVIVIFGIIVFVLYTLGALSNGLKGIVPNLQDFFGTRESTQESVSFVEPEISKKETIKETINENLEAIEIKEDTDISEETSFLNEINVSEEINTTEEIKEEVLSKENPQTEEKPVKKEEPLPEKKQSFFDKIMNYTSNNEKPVSMINPYDYPSLYGSAKVISGDTLLIRNHVIRLYGIDAPSKKQSCSDAKGRAYSCGKQAALWLQNWILDNEIECHVLKQDKKNNVLATCSYGQYDLGAALVMVGWAVPLPDNDVYVPYEREAQKNRSGMWQGKFYKPWDWVNIQSQKPNIKIIKRENKKRFWDYL